MKVVRAGTNITKPEYRQLRASILSYYMSKLHDAMKQVDFRHSILITPDADFLVFDGVTMKSSNRYLKSTGAGTLNQGKKMYDFLLSKGIEAKNVIDLGANWGEVSLHFSMMNRDAKILAVEASTYNFKVLEMNCRMQNFPTDNITLLNEAVSDIKGSVEITKGKSAENTVIKGVWKDAETETVSCDTLSSFIKRFHFEHIDFLKIDIEGSEPALVESLTENIDMIRTLLIEVGKKSPHELYTPLVKFLLKNNMFCFNALDGKLFSNYEKIEQYIFGPDGSSADLWFIKKNLLSYETSS